MKKNILFLFVIFAVLVAGHKSIAADNENPSIQIFFVSTTEELNSALEKTCELQGLAVSAAFYSAQVEKNKTVIKDLVQKVLDCKDRPVFVYGKKLDPKVMASVLGYGVGDGNPLFCGYRYPRSKDKEETLYDGGVVGWDEPELSEERMRAIVNWIWSKE